MTSHSDDDRAPATPERVRSIVRIDLDERSFLRRRPEVEHEREVALFDLLEENTFVLKGEGVAAGPYHLRLALSEDRLVFEVCDTGDTQLQRLVIAVKPFRMVIKDYFLVCESYFDAIKTESAAQIEAIDMGRRALHNEGAGMLKERLAEQVALDHNTARRLFTLLCVLHMRG